MNPTRLRTRHSTKDWKAFLALFPEDEHYMIPASLSLAREYDEHSERQARKAARKSNEETTIS